jgi:hypothetical protein
VAASKVKLFELIRRDSWHGGLSVRALAAKYGVHRRLVREGLTRAEPGLRKVPQRQSPGWSLSRRLSTGGCGRTLTRRASSGTPRRGHVRPPAGEQPVDLPLARRDPQPGAGPAARPVDLIQRGLHHETGGGVDVRLVAQLQELEEHRERPSRPRTAGGSVRGSARSARTSPPRCRCWSRCRTSRSRPGCC